MTPNNFIQLELSRKTKSLFARAEREFGREQVYSRIQRYFDKQAIKAGAQVGQDVARGVYKKPEGERGGLRNRAGFLSKSIIGRGLRVDGVPALKVGIFRGPALRYAGVQELGTKGENPDSPYPTIVPKKAKALAIPMGDALTPAGVARYKSPRNFPEPLVFIPPGKLAKANTVGWLYKQSDIKKVEAEKLTMEDIEPQYRLIDSADIPPKFFLRNGLTQRLPGIASGLSEVLVGIFNGNPQ